MRTICGSPKTTKTQPVSCIGTRPQPHCSEYSASPVTIMNSVPSVYMKNIAACASGLWPTHRSLSGLRKR